mmetsp:Transcript_1223/g.3094  ORF Transcript_1223/g.3094 Transcript_1223/m.3094 type:complete len:206 (-) Transcript_1223:429-1046(-)
MTSGSQASKKDLHFMSISTSVSLEMTCAPTIGRHPLRVKTFWTMGDFSPYTVTALAIWMTGSFSASGKYPFRPWHSMSKDNTRSGAILFHSPSGLREIMSRYVTSTSTWQCVLFLDASLNWYVLAGRVIHPAPETSWSIMYRRTKGTLHSKGWYSFPSGAFTPGRSSPSSMMRLRVGIRVGMATSTLKKCVWGDSYPMMDLCSVS